MLSRRSLLASLALLPASRLYAQAPASQTPLAVVGTFSILGDFIAEIGGARLQVTTLVGPNADTHSYQPKPSDSRLIAGAGLVVVNGLGLEGFIDRLIKAAGSKAPVVTATKGITPLAAREEEHEAGHEHGEGHDPHAWQSVANAKIYVANIRDGLIAADPAGEADYRQRTAAYLARLDQLETDIRADIARVPAAQRRVVSSHDAFGYFDKAYGIEFIPAQGLNADSEPTAHDIATLIRQVKREKVKAVFSENILSPRFAQRIAKETGALVGGTLYSDALSDAKGPAATYIDMMRHNVRTIVQALATS